MNSTVKIRFNHIAIAGYCYLLIPIFVFFMSWLRPVIGIPASLILLFGFFILLRNDYLKNQTELELPLVALIVTALVFLVWVWLSGIGGFFSQTWDQHYRNAVFRDLIEFDWPVYYSETGNALVYNFAHWLVPALFGKLFGWLAGNIALAAWSYIGVFISFLLVVYICKSFTTKRLLFTCAIFVLWSGLDSLGLIGVKALGHQAFWLNDVDEWPSAFSKLTYIGYQYSANDTLLSWVFHQAIAPWIAVPLVLQNKRISSFAFIALCVLPFAPLPFIGLGVILIFIAVPMAFHTLKEKQYGKLLGEIFSIPNISAVLSIFIIFMLFFQSNISGASFGLSDPPSSFDFLRIGTLLLFYLLEFGIYMLLIRKQHKKDIVFLAIVISLVVIPFFKVGHGYDFCMRASIPALFILMIFVIQNAFTLKQLKKQHALTVLVFMLALAIAFINPVYEISARINRFCNITSYEIVVDDIKTFRDKRIGDRSLVLEDTIDRNYENFLVPNPESEFFYEYLAKNAD